MPFPHGLLGTALCLLGRQLEWIVTSPCKAGCCNSLIKANRKQQAPAGSSADPKQHWQSRWARPSMRLHRLREKLEWHLFPPVFSNAQALDQRHEVDLSPACATLGSGWLTRAASLSPQGAVSHAFTTRTLAMSCPPPRTASHNGLEAVPGGGPSNCHSPMQSSCNRSHPGNPPIRRHSIPLLSAMSLARPYLTDAVKILPKKCRTI